MIRVELDNDYISQIFANVVRYEIAQEYPLKRLESMGEHMLV
jgi:hypothetical protein